ncbi:MAG TPA: DUF1622 domain-containing protein [Patescibacteria group bacterium]|nr:DUF1622 domain-containing protein [Patescibacteria group bacterium]
MDAFTLALYVGEILDLFGVFIILFGVILATVIAVRNYFTKRRMNGTELYRIYRTHLAKAVLLGLEVLVAGDIIRSVVGHPTFTTVGILAAIVLIRSFLSVTFDMEVSGHWPWKGKNS